MKIAPLTTADPWVHRAMADGRTDAQMLSGVPVDLIVQMELVEICHTGVSENYRPYLHMRGAISRVEPEEALPYEITALPLSPKSTPTTDVFYEFSRDQLQEMVAKDYFSERFSVPDVMMGIPWELPGTVDFLVVSPEAVDEPPLVFMRVHELNSQVLDADTSGYDLVENFPDFSLLTDASAPVAEQRAAAVRADAVSDLFVGVDFDQPENRVDPAVSAASAKEVPESLFERLMADAQAERDRAEAEALASDDYDPTTIEGKARHVAREVEKALALAAETIEEKAPLGELDEELDEAEAESSAPVVGFLDLSAPDEELDIAPVSTGDVAERRAQARRRRPIVEATPDAGDEVVPEAGGDEPTM